MKKLYNNFLYKEEKTMADLVNGVAEAMEDAGMDVTIMEAATEKSGNVLKTVGTFFAGTAVGAGVVVLGKKLVTAVKENKTEIDETKKEAQINKAKKQMEAAQKKLEELTKRPEENSEEVEE